HEEYFKTMRTLIGLGKVIEPSFISEHMLFRCDLVKALMKRIEDNDAVPGESWWEKILYAIRSEKLLDNSFSEFETYGTFVALTVPGAYRLREWHSFRYAAEFFEIDKIGERDYYWLSRDFTAASFEKNMSIRDDHRGLFDNPTYQEKISARQMLEAVQAEFDEGYLEKWDLPRVVTKAEERQQIETGQDKPGETTASARPARLRYLEEDTYREYEVMGDSLAEKKPEQAYLCYENAAFLATDETERTRLTEKKETYTAKHPVDVRKTCILILSYNQRYLTEKCLESIADNCDPANVSVIVLDNASADDSPKWLHEYIDTHKAEDGNIEMMLLLSDENLGFPAGCNAAAEYAPEDADLFLLNNDTRLPANALFRMKMCLYEKEDIGAVGAVQNYNANKDQTQEVELSLPEQYMAYGAKHNRTVNDPPEEQKKLSGFAMLIRHGLFHALGGFDERFSPGYYEDDDLCLRIRREGFRLFVCRGSFIYHAGSQSFAKKSAVEELVERNHLKFIEKWGAEAQDMDGNR
ncbi:MAG: glycosyltransferase family 2 protein, partial [Lachnospiraceae bacterium]|nr:glycosyltransferase family 2 protein [Lachnospiraceae bacterium]